MEATIININKKFEPQTIQITLETKEEVVEFYARMNAAVAKIDNSRPEGTPAIECGNFTKLFRIAEKLYKMTI